MQTGIDFLVTHLAKPLIEHIRKEANVLTLTEHLICDCCGRPSEQWLYPTEYVESKPYGEIETHCLACHTLFVSSAAHFGPGSRTNKLGMMRGLGALITPSKTTVYAPKKYYTRFTNLKTSLFDEVLDLSGFSSIIHAWEKMPKDEPFLLITDFGVKKNALVSNLHVSQGEQVFVCSEKDNVRLSRSEIPSPKPFANVPKKDTDELINLLLKKTRQHITRKELALIAAICRDYPQLLPTIKNLPSDPHIREFVLRVLRRNLEVLK